MLVQVLAPVPVPVPVPVCVCSVLCVVTLRSPFASSHAFCLDCGLTSLSGLAEAGTSRPENVTLDTQSTSTKHTNMHTEQTKDTTETDTYMQHARAAKNTATSIRRACRVCVFCMRTFCGQWWVVCCCGFCFCFCFCFHFCLSLSLSVSVTEDVYFSSVSQSPSASPNNHARKIADALAVLYLLDKGDTVLSVRRKKAVSRF